MASGEKRKYRISSVAMAYGVAARRRHQWRIIGIVAYQHHQHGA